MDVLAAQDERRKKRTAKSCGPDAPMLASTRDNALHCAGTGARKPDSRGEREETRKTIAQGMPDDGVVPVVTNSSCFFTFAREAMGAARTRHSLRPLFGGWFAQQLGRHPRREGVDSHPLFDN